MSERIGDNRLAEVWQRGPTPELLRQTLGQLPTVAVRVDGEMASFVEIMRQGRRVVDNKGRSGVFETYGWQWGQRRQRVSFAASERGKMWIKVGEGRFEIWSGERISEARGRLDNLGGVVEPWVESVWSAVGFEGEIGESMRRGTFGLLEELSAKAAMLEMLGRGETEPLATVVFWGERTEVAKRIEELKKLRVDWLAVAGLRVLGWGLEKVGAIGRVEKFGERWMPDTAIRMPEARRLQVRI